MGGDGALADERDCDGLGANALVRDAAGGVGDAPGGGNELAVRRAVLSALELPRTCPQETWNGFGLEELTRLRPSSSTDGKIAKKKPRDDYSRPGAIPRLESRG